MGELDKAGKRFLGMKDIFADLLNYFFYDGEQNILPKEVHECDPTELKTLSTQRGEVLGWLERVRDIAKFVVLRECRDVRFMVVGVEIQSRVDCGMVVRCMEYEAMEYDAQLKRLAAANRLATNKAVKECEGAPESRGRRLSADEWISGVKADDKLVPVTTLVVYCGEGRWTGPRSLHELLGLTDEPFKSRVADYRLNLIEPAAMAAEDFEKLHTDLSLALNYLGAQRDPEKLAALATSESIGHRQYVSREAFDFINTAMNLQLEMVENKDGGVDMCTAQKILLERARREGTENGRAEERDKGIRRLINVLRGLGLGLEDIRKKLEESYSLNEREAAAYLHSSAELT